MISKGILIKSITLIKGSVTVQFLGCNWSKSREQVNATKDGLCQNNLYVQFDGNLDTLYIPCFGSGAAGRGVNHFIYTRWAGGMMSSDRKTLLTILFGI
jgi:hypothetical protein